MVDDSSFCQSRYISSRTLVWGRRQGAVVRHGGYLPTVIVGIALALLVPFISSANVEAATTDKTVEGAVYDQTSSPLAGADVTVAIWGGDWPYETILRASQSTVTDAWGHYEVTFSSNYWDPHNTIKVAVTYSATEKNRNVEANGDQYQTVDVSINLAIPEFSSPVGLLAMMAGCVVPVVVLVARRRR